MKLSDAFARAAVPPPGRPDVVFWDDELKGFGLRVRQTTAGIAKVWMIQYRDALQKDHRFNIASAHGSNFKNARKTADKLLAGIKLGTYPHVERVKRREAAERELDRARETFGVISELYLDRQRRTLRPRSIEQSTYHITKSWAPFHRLSIHEIDRRMIADRLTEIVKVNGPHAANKARVILGAMFAWAVKDGRVKSNPVARTNKPHEEKPRRRVLSERELVAIWNACGRDNVCPGDDAYGRIVRILMLTGQRRQEIGNLRWEELDLGAGTLTIPEKRSKTHEPSVVPLVPEVVSLIESMPRDHATVFGGAKVGFDNFSKAKVALDKKIAEELGAPLADWRLHDLRRSMATTMAEKLRVRSEVVERILNHIPPGIKRVYNVAVYPEETREALEKWAAYLHAVVTGDDRKVIRLRQGVSAA
jgi:integrase